MQKYQIKNIELPENIIDDISQGMSPRMQRRSSISNLTPKILQKCDLVGQFQYMQLYQILQKSFTNRTHNENRFINQFIKKNTTMKELSEIVSKQFCKGIMRTAIIEEYNEHQIIQQKGSEVNKIYIILQGKAASIKNQNETDMIEHIKLREIYQILMNASRKQAKKINKLSRKFSSQRDESGIVHEKYQFNGDQQYLEYFQKGSIFGDKVRCFNKQYPHTVIALQKCLVLAIGIKNIIFWLNHAFQLKLQKLYKLLKNHPLFAHFDHQILEQLISYMCLHKRKKNEIVYQQGTQSFFICFLEQGQLKIQKQCHLFVDNPNELYIDRRKLMNKRQINNKQFLPYANFEHLYNYRPINKIIELGILTPFCIFGEEQILQNKKRETTIRCSSLHSVYYSIETKRIYQILNDKMGQFIQSIKQSVKDKIKYRQQAYASAINLQNKNNLKYFYYQGQQDLPTPRKYIIKKINQKICNNCPNFGQKIKDNLSIYSQALTDTIQDSNPQIKYRPQPQQLKGTIPPLYNTFNFHKLMKTKLANNSLSKATLQQLQSQQDKGELQNRVRLKMKEQLKKQQKIIDNSHTWRLVKQKVRQQQRLSKRKGSFKYNINFMTPLIEHKYFQQIETQIKKIDRQQKSGKFSISNPKRRVGSLNSIIISQ